MVKKKKEKTVDDYVAIAKTDIFVYAFIFLFLLAGAGMIALVSEWYYGLGLSVPILFLSMRVPERIMTYFHLKQLKQYIVDHNLQDVMGKIDFWNEENYFLTEKYMIILYKKMILHFQYEEIEKMYEKKTVTPGSIRYHLHIVLKNKQEIKVLTYSTVLAGEEIFDIRKYLLDKNSEIEEIRI